ncbi:MAG: two-component system response regulator [Nitrospirae bacterium GWC2_56_14]|nr:MAG: two-component system response regulator [Nitrospirae bacterium GWC2_56_14]
MGTVLIVEDNDYNLRLMSYVLKRDGYQVVAADSGEKGVEMADREQPELIIMDINLPGIDGLETTRRIRDLGGTMPIIAITSRAMTGDRETILEAGCNGYIEKPYDPATVMDQIRGFISAAGTGTEQKGAP